jgi:putative transport protein
VPEVFIVLAVAIGTLLGRVRIHGFSLGAPACTLIVAVMLGQIGMIVIPPLFKAIFFGFFVFTIGYRSGPSFFASLSLQTVSQSHWPSSSGHAGLSSFSLLPTCCSSVRAPSRVLAPAV